MKIPYGLLAVITFILMIATNYLSTTGIISWFSMRGLENTFPFPYMPPGIAFAISWGTIYLLVSLYTVSLLYRIVTDFETSTKQETIYFSGLNLLNASWVISTAFKQYIFSGIIIFLMFGLLYIFLKKFGHDIYKNIAFGIYLGWITVAAFCLTVAQIVYLTLGDIALSTSFGNSMLLFGAIITGIIFWNIRNPYALLWSVGAIIIAGAKMYGFIS